MTRWRLSGEKTCGALLAVAMALISAKGRADEGRSAGDHQSEAKVKIDFDAPPKAVRGDDGEIAPGLAPIDDIFRNPAVAANLASGVDAINRSVDTFMEQVFYSLLDNERNVDLTGQIWLNARLSRKLFSTPTGAYVVVDRFDFGPRYLKELWRVQNIPITLGADGTVDLLQIYLRNDGMRLAEQESLSRLRILVNEWFGIVPALARILPPSFNQNQLYDPVTQLQTPMSFPFDAKALNSMPVGAIRSYAISGGIRLSADFGGLLPKSALDDLDRIGGLDAGVPYSIFRTGEHRINVLRRSKTVAWVGVTDTKRIGHGFSPAVGQRYFILKGALAATAFGYNWLWPGIPVSILPIDLQVEQALVGLFDQIYEYDLTRPEAQLAYEAAVRGDFLPSRNRYLDAREKKLNTGVSFRFASTQDRRETTSRNGPNVGVYKRERRRDHHVAEIEVRDQVGKFYVLETSLETADKQSNILVGESEARTQHVIEMKVKRVFDKKNPQVYSYVYEIDPDPYRLTLSLSIQDRYTDTKSYAGYIEQLRFFTGLALRDVPIFPLRDVERLRAQRAVAFFEPPHGQVATIHVPPTYIGSFGAQATLSFSAKELGKIIDADVSDIWGAYAKAFGADETRWRDPAARESLAFQAQWFRAFFLYPLRLLNFRLPSVDAIVEAQHGVEQLLALKALTAPLARIDGFLDLLDSDHPRELGRVFLELADLGEISRRVTFSTTPKGNASDDIKGLYGKLDHKTFRGGPPFPPVGRYARAQAERSSFYLDRPRQDLRRPELARITLASRGVAPTPPDLDAMDLTGSARAVSQWGQVFLTFSVTGVSPTAPLKLYMKIEEGGRLKLGKLELSEKVVNLAPLPGPPGKGEATFALFATGPSSPMNTFMLDQALAGGDELQITMAVSADGVSWSDERTVEFRYDRGHLYPVK